MVLVKTLVISWRKKLGNCPPTPPSNPTLTLTSQFVQNVVLGEG